MSISHRVRSLERQYQPRGQQRCPECPQWPLYIEVCVGEPVPEYPARCPNCGCVPRLAAIIVEHPAEE
jgi:hypothetical protein